MRYLRLWMLITVSIGIPTIGMAAHPSMEAKAVHWLESTLNTKCVKQPFDPLVDEKSEEGTENHYDCGKSVHLLVKISNKAKGPFLSRITLRTESSKKKTPIQLEPFGTQVMSWLSEDGLECVSGPSGNSKEEAYVCQSPKPEDDQTVTVARQSSPGGGTSLDYYFYPR